MPSKPVVAKKGKKGKTNWREQYLWKRLEEVDREMANEEKRAELKRERAVERARVRKGAGVNQPSILTQFRKLAGSSNTRASNRPSKVTLVATGQSNGSTSTNPVMGVCWRQDEHLLSNRVPGGEDESGGVAQEVCQDQVSREEQRQDGEELPVVSSKPNGRRNKPGSSPCARQRRGEESAP